jgi:hypothetical protein
MTEDVKQIDGIIFSLNREIARQTESSATMLQPLVFVSDGDSQGIKFLGLSVWNSDEDEREEKDGELEPLEGFVRREVQELIETISNIKLVSKLKLA